MSPRVDHGWEAAEDLSPVTLELGAFHQEAFDIEVVMLGADMESGGAW
jgi:hypothetical protein